MSCGVRASGDGDVFFTAIDPDVGAEGSRLDASGDLSE